MNKKQKIAVAVASLVVAAVLAAIIIIAVFFPGFPVLMKLKGSFKNKNSIPETYSYYDTQVPQDFIEISEYGLSLRVPPHVERTDPDSTVKKYTGADDIIIIFTEPDDGGFSLSEALPGFTESELDDFFSTSSIERPDSTYDYYNVIYNLNMDSFDVKNRSNAEIFQKLAEQKDDMFPDIQLYNYSAGSLTGFIENLHVPDADADNYSWMLHLYDTDNLDVEYSVFISAADVEIVKQIAGSASMLQ